MRIHITGVQYRPTARLLSWVCTLAFTNVLSNPHPSGLPTWVQNTSTSPVVHRPFSMIVEAILIILALCAYFYHYVTKQFDFFKVRLYLLCIITIIQYKKNHFFFPFVKTFFTYIHRARMSSSYLICSYKFYMYLYNIDYVGFSV